MSDDREGWARTMMSGIAGGCVPQMPSEPNDEWTQEDIDRSLENEAKLAIVRDRYDRRLDELLDHIASGYEPAAGMLTDLQRDRKTIEEMLAGMGRARGWRVKAKDTSPI